MRKEGSETDGTFTPNTHIAVPMEVAQTALSRPAEQRVAMAVRFQASSADTSALSASDPVFRLHLLILRFSNGSLPAYRV